MNLTRNAWLSKYTKGTASIIQPHILEKKHTVIEARQNSITIRVFIILSPLFSLANAYLFYKMNPSLFIYFTTILNFVIWKKSIGAFKRGEAPLSFSSPSP